MGFRRCYKCMADLSGTVSPICPVCGFDNAHPQQPEQALACGSILGGRYMIGKMLGQGGFGITYIGFDVKLEEAVCIKEFFPSGIAVRTREMRGIVYWSGDSDEISGKLKRESFVNEARKAVKVRNLPSVVNVWDVLYENETAYIVMDYIKGVTLKDYLLKRGIPMDIRECFTLLKPVIRDLHEVHRKGIIHRDISPDNLMIREDGRIVLLDLGAAKDLSLGTDQSTSIVIKRGFSPPEQYYGHSEIGPWTDVYAMTATIYWCMTLQYVPDAAQRWIRDTLSIPPQIPPRTAAALRHGLALKPEKRTRDCIALLRELEKASRTRTEPRKNTNILLSAVIVAGLILCAALFVSVLLGRKSGTEFDSNPGNRTEEKIAADQEPLAEPSTPGEREDQEENDEEKTKSSHESALSHIGDTPEEPGKTTEITRSSDAPMAITDSWEQIIAASKDGTYKERYRIGDTKELDLGEEGIIHMKLAAIDADELADGSGKAPMTWIAEELINSEHRMNEEDTAEGGWPESEMRAWLREDILPLFPGNVRSNIKEVTKYSYSYLDDGAVSSNDAIWIPSNREIFKIDDLYYKDCYEDHGPEYTSAFQEDESRVRHRIDASHASWWWLRSSYYGSSFYCVYTDGSYISRRAASQGGVVVGFCL